MEIRNAARRYYLQNVNSSPKLLHSAHLLTTGGALLTLEFSPGITALVGGNGAGKTRILGSVAGSLSGRSDPGVPDPPAWLDSIDVLGADANGDPWISSSDADSDDWNCPINVRYLDVSRSTEAVINTYSRDAHSADFIDGIDPIEFSESELRIASFLVGRTYEQISVYEVTDLSSDDDPIPYITVSTGGVSYGPDAMGRGEFSAIYLLWRFGTLEPNSVVLLEEPETHLATRCHGPLLDYLAFCALKRRVQIVISTHSPMMIRRLPDAHTVRCESLPIPIIDTSIGSRDLSLHLGLSGESRILIATEDAAASALCREILASEDPEVLQRSELVHHKDGESAVVHFVTGCRNSDGSHPRGVVAVLDGDQRSSANDHGRYFLPSSSSPDAFCREAFISWRSKPDRPPLNIPSTSMAQVLMSLDEAAGMEDHDWFLAMSQRFGGMSVIARVSLELRKDDPGIRQHIDELIEQLRRHLS